MRVLVDMHHSSLHRSLVILLSDRLGCDVFRPIGMEWWEQGLWAVYPAEDTARQYLGYAEQAIVPADGTPPLNELTVDGVNGWPGGGIYRVYDPGKCSTHMACTLDWFQQHDFDLLVCSLPQHLPIFDRLADMQRSRGVDCQVVMQVGNEWDLTPYRGRRLLASLRPRPLPGYDVCWYHQEFEQTFFRPRPALPTGQVSCFMNVLPDDRHAWGMFQALEHAAPELAWRSFGGQCRDGCAWGHEQMGEWLADSMAVFHPKRNDGYGHVIYNCYSVGRPVMVHRSALAPFLCDELLRPGTFIDLDDGLAGAVAQLRYWRDTPHELLAAGERCRAAFDAAVDFEGEAQMIGDWLGIDTKGNR